jgi:heme-degrading monooxygenase HmoA
MAQYTDAMTRTVEIRSYKLKPGAGPAFERLFREQAAPLVRAYGMDVLAFGKSAHDDDGYFLIRAFDSLQHLTQSEDEFYGSPQWRNGPREAVLSHIESYQDTVLTLSADAAERLRADLA